VKRPAVPFKALFVAVVAALIVLSLIAAMPEPVPAVEIRPTSSLTLVSASMPRTARRYAVRLPIVGFA
jgi:hypothetical protein